MNIRENDVIMYIRRKYNLDQEQALMKVPKKYRVEILNDVFNHFTGYRLYYHIGLKSLKRKDVFDNYRSFDHIENFEQLIFDLNQTKKQSRNNLARWKRKLHRVRKERFEARKKQRLNELTKKVYKQKWEPNNNLTKERLKKLSELKKKEQNKEYER